MRFRSINASVKKSWRKLVETEPRRLQLTTTTTLTDMEEGRAEDSWVRGTEKVNGAEEGQKEREDDGGGGRG